MTNADFSAVIPAPFGAIGIVSRDGFLLACELLSDSLAEKIATDVFTQSVVNQMTAYLANAQTPLHSPYAVQGTAFQKRVWQAISSIPCGQVLNYTQLADKVGSGPRAVANACGANHVTLFIPCHRVVAKLNAHKNSLGGFMQGHANGLSIKQWLLAHEGVVL